MPRLSDTVCIVRRICNCKSIFLVLNAESSKDTNGGVCVSQMRTQSVEVFQWNPFFVLCCLVGDFQFSCSNMEQFSARDLYTLRHVKRYTHINRAVLRTGSVVVVPRLQRVNRSYSVSCPPKLVDCKATHAMPCSLGDFSAQGKSLDFTIVRHFHVGPRHAVGAIGPLELDNTDGRRSLVRRACATEFGSAHWRKRRLDAVLLGCLRCVTANERLGSDVTSLLRAASELSCASPPLDSPDATMHKRSGGAEEGILDVRMCGERRLFAQVTLFASGFVIGKPRRDRLRTPWHDGRNAVCLFV